MNQDKKKWVSWTQIRLQGAPFSQMQARILKKIETQGESSTNLSSTSRNSKTCSQKLSLIKILNALKL